MLGSCLLEDPTNYSDETEDSSEEDGSQESGSREDDSQDDSSGEDDSQENSSQAAAFIKCRAVSENEIEFEFSKPVMVKTLSFEPALTVSSIEDGNIVSVLLEENAAMGLQVAADLLAEDEHGNEINVSTSLRFRDSRIPLLVINELCTEYATNSKGEKKAEFIELKMKSYGNLDGIRIFIMGNSNVVKLRITIYEFMPVKVKEDEYVVLHLRTLEESCKDEKNGNIEESGGINSSSTAWDFYVSGNDKLIHTAATAVYVLDQDDNVLDAVMISTLPDPWWDKGYFAEAAEFLFGKGAWKTAEGEVCGPVNAVNSNGATNTRTICRDRTVEDTNTAADWYVTDTSCATPGKDNNDKRYTNKK